MSMNFGLKHLNERVACTKRPILFVFKAYQLEQALRNCFGKFNSSIMLKVTLLDFIFFNIL
jgi:hypothetical protein